MASAALKGITITIGGGTTGLNSALDGIDSHTRSLSKSLRQVEDILRWNPDSIEMLGQSTHRPRAPCLGDSRVRP